MKFENCLSRWSSEALSIVRIFSALSFLSHGTQKLFSFPDASRPAVEWASFMGFTGILELVGGILLAIGLFSRPVAFILSGQMAVAYWMVHAKASFFPMLNGGEAAMLYCFIFLYIACAGPGVWSLDALRSRTATL
jgi:putative oxidoreductase